jgi:MoxR-like ATPase
MVLSYEALADGISADDLLTPLLDSIALPDLPLRERRAHAGGPSWTTHQR